MNKHRKKVADMSLEEVDIQRQKNRANYAKNRTKMLERAAKYREENRDILNKKNKERYYGNLDRYRAQAREYQRQRNQDEKRAYMAKYQENNKVKIAVRAKQKYHTNPQSKLKNLLSSRIRYAFKHDGLTKNDRTKDLIGCSLSECKTHIESLFLPGMTWDNHGKWKKGRPMTWHVDHIKPCDSFDLSDPLQKQACFHYTNLQPLWAIDNYRKSNKII